jgi:Ca2+-binding RTX toxin-like protein
MFRKSKRRPYVRRDWRRLRLEQLEDRTLLSVDHLAITTQPPSTVLAGSPFQVIVQVDDTNGTPDPNYIGNVSVAIAPGTGPAGASLRGTTTVPITNGSGIAQFNNLMVNLPGSGAALPPTSYTLQISPDGLTSVDTEPFDASALALTGYKYTRQGLNFTYTVSGAPLPQSVPVSLDWADGPSLAGLHEQLPVDPASNPWATIPAGQVPSATDYTQTVPAKVLVGSPDYAQYLLVVLNQDVQPVSLAPDIPRVSQGPNRQVGGGTWATDILGDSQNNTTIQEGGCLLVSLDMALNYAGVATDPGALNDELDATQVPFRDGYFPKTGHVNLGAATAIAAHAAGFSNLAFFSPPFPVITALQLRNLLTSTGAPVIVKVANPHDLTATVSAGDTTIHGLLTLQSLEVGEPVEGYGIPEGAYVKSIDSAKDTFVISAAPTKDAVLDSLTYYSTHFVLVTGLDGSAFHINDPGYADRKTLDFYRKGFLAVGYVQDPTDNSAMYIASASKDGDVGLSVTNASGQTTGVGAPGSTPTDQIPNALYFEDGPLEGQSTDDTTVQYVYIDQPGSENYTIASTGAGDYTLATSGELPSGSPTAATVFTASASSLEPNDVTADSSDGQITFPQETPEVNIIAKDAVSNGSPDAATGSITDANGNTATTLEGVGLQLTYYTGTTVSGAGSTTAPTAAGTYTVVALFPGSTDYTSASDQATFTISPPAVTVPLQQVLDTSDTGLGSLDQGSADAAIVGQGLGMNGLRLPMVNVTLDAALNLTQDLVIPFQTSLGLFQGALAQPGGVNWQSLAADLQNAGFSIPLPFTGTPDAQGNLLEVAFNQSVNLPSVPLLVTGTTGFNYLDGAGGGLFGALNGSGSVSVSVTFGVDINAQKQLGFFILPSANTIQATLVGSTSSDGLSGSLAIGDLANVSASAAGSITITGTLGLKATASDGKIRVASLTNNLAQVVTGGINGSVQLNASFDAQLTGLPDVQWTGTFSEGILNSVLQTPSVSLQEPSVSSLLSSLGASLFSLGDDIPILGPLSGALNRPLPVIGKSVAQITGLDGALPTLPSLPVNFDSLNGSYPLAGGFLTVNVTPTTIDEFLHGQPVDLISWEASGNVTLLDKKLNIPIFSLGVPDIASVDINATLRMNAALHYDVGFGLDGHGFWLRAGNPSSPDLGLSFSITAGLEGDVKVFGFPIASAGGSIGFSVTPYVTLTAPPWATDPRKVYTSDLALFGSNPLSDIADDLSAGIQGALTGEVHASIDLLLFSISWSWGIKIPVFNYQRGPSWPAGAGSGRGGVFSLFDSHVSQNGGVLTFTGTPGNDNLSLSEGSPGSVTIHWAGVGQQTYAGVSEFDLVGAGGNERLTTAPGFSIPIRTQLNGNDYIQGGAGADTLIAGAGKDTLVAGSGNESLVGGSGTDLLIGGSGNDTIVAGTGTDSIFGGNGNSTIYGGSGNDSIYAGSGNDLIQGGSGTYFIDGGSGSDTINAGTGANDSIYGGSAGHNLITGSSGGYNLIYGGGPGDTLNGGAGGNDTLYGSAGGYPAAVTSNVITGGAKGNNLIFGGGSGDLLFGPLGNNTLYGGNGNETLYGGDGKDLQFNPLASGLVDAAGDDLSGGNNLLVGGTGNDVIYGDSSGNNTLQAGPGNDTLYAGSGADYLQAGPGTDALYGGGGGDHFELPFTPVGQQQPPDTLVGGAGVNTLVLRPPAASTPASPVAPTQLSAAVSDTNPTDAITVQSAANISVNSVIQIDSEQMKVTAVSGTTLTVNRGFNSTAVATHRAAAPVLILPQTPEAPSGDYQIYFTSVAGTTNQYQATLSNLDTGAALGQLTVTMPSSIANIDLEGGAGNNWIQVDPSVTRNVHLYGGPGNNTLMAGSGNDTLVAGPGTGVLYGGTGNDILYGGDEPLQDAQPQLSAFGHVTPYAHPTEGHDTLIAGSGDAELFAGSGGDVLIGGSVARQVGPGGTPGLALLQNGQYQLIDGAGRDVLAGGRGNDLLIAGPGGPGAMLEAGSGNDVLVADNFGSNVLKGGSGATNLLIGGNLNNVLIGGSGSDTLVGGLGLNTILAGSGNDALYATYSAAAWSQASAIAAADGVHLVPPNLFQGDAQDQAIEKLLIAQAKGLNVQSQLHAALIPEFENLANQEASLNNQIIALLNIPNLSQAQQQQLINLENQDQVIQADVIAVLTQLGANEFVDSLFGGSGNDQFYGNPNTATYMGGGTGNETFYNYNGFDTIAGAAGAENPNVSGTLMFQGDGNINLQPITVNQQQNAVFVEMTTRTATTTNGSTTITGLASTSGLMVGQSVTGAGIPAGTLIYSINADGSVTLTNNATASATGVPLTFGWIVGNEGNITGISTIAVQTGSGNDTVTAGNFQAARLNLYVQCGNGNDTVDASAFTNPETLLAGSGSDVLKIGAVLATGTNSATGLPNTVIQPSTTGNTELDIFDTISDPITVKAGVVKIGGFQQSVAAFHKVVMIGGPGTNSFTTDGSVPNVLLEGGPGTNVFSAAGGQPTLIGGSGADNAFTITGPGGYTVIGGKTGAPAPPFTSGVSAPASSGTSQSTLTPPDGGSILTTVGTKVLYGGSGSVVDVYDLSTAQWSSGTLSQARTGFAVATVATKVLLAGGMTTGGALSNVVDIYDASTGQWSSSTLSTSRSGIAVATVGTTVVLAGGALGSGNYSNAVDIYDAGTGQWSTGMLSQIRYGFALRTVGTKVLFAGGIASSGANSNVVDMYDASTGRWSPSATLPQGLAGVIAATTVGTKAVFVGDNATGTVSNLVDIYDASTGQWSTTTLSGLPVIGVAATVGSQALFVAEHAFDFPSTPNIAFDIYDASTGQWSVAGLSQAREGFGITTVGTKVILAGGDYWVGPPLGGHTVYSNAVDIYDSSTGQWSTATLSQAGDPIAAAAVGTKAIIAEVNNVADIYDASTGQWSTVTFSGLNGAVTIGTEAIFGGREVLTFPPLVKVATPANPAHGSATIPYTLIDSASNPCSIQVQYSVSGGPWQIATPDSGGDGTSSLTSSPAGIAHTYVWNTAQDLGSTNNPSVQVRIIPSDAIGIGFTQASGTFPVDNTSINALTIAFNDSNNDTVKLVQNGSLVSIGGSMTGTATNMTSITVVGGTGKNLLDASQTVMPVTLNGGNGSGADTLIGGAASDTFYYSGTGSSYTGGPGAANTLVYPASTGDIIALMGPELVVNGKSMNLGNVSGIEDWLVSGSPASVNNGQQLLWPFDDVPPTNVTVNGVTVASGSPFAVLSASFTDANPNASLSTESAWITWGDGTSSAGTIASSSTDNYTLSASHIFATNATYPISLTVIDSLGAATTASTTFSGGLAVSNGALDNYAGTTPTVVDSGDSGVESYVVRAADATVFSLHNNGDLFAFSGSGSKQVDASVQSIYVGPDATLYALHSGGSLYTSASGSSNLSFYASNVQALVQDASGSLYELTNGSLYVLQAGSSWTLVQTGVESIALATGGAAVNVVQTDGDSWQYSGTAGVLLGGPQFSFNVPATVTAGQPVSVTLTVLDAFGHPVTGYTGTVQLASSDAAAVAAGGPLPVHTFTATDAGAFAFTTTFLTSGTQTIAATDGNGDTGSVSLTVKPAAATLFSVDPPAAVAGQPVPITVTAYDPYGNVATGYTGTVRLSATGVHASYSFASGDQGIRTQNVTFSIAGSQKLTATDAGGNTGAGSIVVTAAPVDLSQSTVSAPASVRAGGTVAVTLTARDANGNQETGGGLTVSFGLAPGSGGGSFGPTIDNGNGTYSALFTAGTALGSETFFGNIISNNTAQPLTSSPATTVVTAGPPSPTLSSLSISSATLVAGGTATVTLTAVDAFGNAEPGGLPLHFSLGTGAGGGSFGAVAYVGGGTYTAVFTATTAGSNTVNATLNGQPVTATPASVQVTAGPPDLFQSTAAAASATVPGGSTTTLTLTARDSYGNPESGPLTAGFELAAGSAGGTFGPLVSLGDGVYSETFSPTGAGTDTIVATINGQPLTSAAVVVSVPVTPSGTIATVTPTFTWPVVPNTDHYVLSVADTTTGQVVLSASNLATAVLSLTPAQALTPGHSYSWLAQAVSSKGQVSAASGTVSFRVAPLAAPTPTSPSGPMATDTPTFTWTARADAAHVTPDHFTLKVTDKGTGLVLTIPNLTGTLRTLSTAQALTPGHSYTWSVTAFSSNGRASVSSVSQSFTVEPLAAPATTGPSGALTTDTPTFTWTPLINALYTAPARYRLAVTDRATGQFLIIGNLTGTSYTLTAAQALTPGHSYRWTVAAVSTNGQVSVWSRGNHPIITIDPLGAPVPTSPTGTLTTDRPTFSWTVALGANTTAPARYTIEVIDKSSGQVLIIPNVTGTTYTLTPAQALTPGHRFVWSVTAVSTNRQARIGSAGQSFSIAALTAPVLVSVSSETFTWQPVIDANRYDFQIVDSTTGHMVVSVPNVAGTAYTLTSAQARVLISGRRYIWYAAAVSTNGSVVVWSGGQSFTAPA